MGRCTNCPFMHSKTIEARGNPDAKVAIIGEAPGREELIQGIPFVGPSGKLLQKVADKVGLSLEENDVYITNSMCCLPTENGKPITPKKAHIEACRGRLLSEIGAKRTLIITMGNTALRAITGDFHAKITQERGKVYDTEIGLILPTFHPAAILRNQSNYPSLVEDLQYAKELIDSNGASRKSMGETEYIVVDKVHFTRIMFELVNVDYCAADIETTSLNPYTGEIVCVGLCYKPNLVYIFDREHLDLLYKVFHAYQGRVEFVWHNGKFDTKFLRKYGVPASTDHDTMLLSYSLDERTGIHGLKELSGRFLGVEDWSDELFEYTDKNEPNYGEIPSEVLYPYLAIDCDATLQLFNLFYPQVLEDKYLNSLYHNVLIPASEFLQDVENNGIYVNKQTLHEVSEQLTRKIKDLRQELTILAHRSGWNSELYMKETGAKKQPAEFNPGSPAQVKWLLYSRNCLKLRVPRGFPTNTAEETLESLPSNEFVDKLLEYRGTTKQYNTYIKGIHKYLAQSQDDRIRASFLQHATVTGRLSSREPNMQNIPRDSTIRQLFQAPPGRTLVEIDYSQAELRTLAYLSQDEFLTKVYLEGKDLHSEMAVRLFGQNYTYEQRTDAKTANFAMLYGATAGKLSKMTNLTYQEAEEVIRTLFASMPQAKSFLDRCKRAGRYGHTITTPFGRKRRFHLVSPEQQWMIENEASNFPIQSIASDLTLISGIEINAMLQDSGHAKVVNIVHDSILIEVVSDNYIIQEIVDDCVSIMCSVPEMYLRCLVPFEAEAKIGQAWGLLRDIEDLQKAN